MTTEEIWKPVVGYEGFYEVSSKGRVQSVDRRVPVGNRSNFRRGVVLKPANVGGYQSVTLWREGKQRSRKVFRLMAEAFLPNPEGYPLVRHLNDDKLDNRLENLRWGTWSENTQDSVRNGTHFLSGVETCVNGHPLTEDNVYRPPGKNSRSCRECGRIRSRAWKEKRGGL